MSPGAALRVLDDAAAARAGGTTVLLVNVGTPDAPTPAAVRRYLAEFLSDPGVLDMPALTRWLLLHLVILPLRPRRSAAAYRKVWREDGSPLRVHTVAFAAALQGRLPDVKVEVAMRYGSSSIAEAIAASAARRDARLVVVPMFPQRAGATTGSVVAEVLRRAGEHRHVPTLSVVPPFFAAPGFVERIASKIAEVTKGRDCEHVLCTYHGLPLRHVRDARAGGRACDGRDGSSCCDTLGPENADCYRAQCMATTALVKGALVGAGVAMPVSTSFQSRFGRAEWIGPDTEGVLRALAARGVRRVAVACPAFVADCLETLEEIGVRAREAFVAAGGEELVLVPCLNDDAGFADTIAAQVRIALGEPAPEDDLAKSRRSAGGTR